MQLTIKLLTGKKLNMNFEPDQQVLVIKQSIQDKEGISVEQIKLIFMGKQLDDQETIADSGLKGGSMIHMVLQMRGGC